MKNSTTFEQDNLEVTPIWFAIGFNTIMRTTSTISSKGEEALVNYHDFEKQTNQTVDQVHKTKFKARPTKANEEPHHLRPRQLGTSANLVCHKIHQTPPTPYFIYSSKSFKQNNNEVVSLRNWR